LPTGRFGLAAICPSFLLFVFCCAFVLEGEAARLYLGYACADFAGLLSVSDSDDLVIFSARIQCYTLLGRNFNLRLLEIKIF
jgi:hypothetical protein